MSEPTPKPLFDLRLTDEQQLMRDTVRKFVDTQMRPIARKCDEAAVMPPEFLARSVELGVNAAQLPEAIGGYGAQRSPMSNTLLVEVLAAGDMSLALGVMSSLSFVNAVLDHGTADQQRTWLSRFGDEAFHPAAVAWAEPGARFDPAKLATQARKRGAGYVLSGAKTLVPFGADAECLLVIADVEGEGPTAFVVEGRAPGLHSTREAFMGLRSLPMSRVVLTDVEVPASARLGDGGRFDAARLLDLSRIGAAALAVGVGQAVLDYVKAYCNERVAFGEPITHRQSVAFMIADMAIELDAMRLLTYRAASRAEQGLPFRREAYLAHLQAAEKGMKIGTDGVQLLGGHGFIREHMVELFYRNLRAVSSLDGVMVV